MRHSIQLVAREAFPQLIEKSEPMKCQDLLQSFLEEAGGLAVDLLQLGVKTGEPTFGGPVGRLLTGPLQLQSVRLGVALTQKHAPHQGQHLPISGRGPEWA